MDLESQRNLLRRIKISSLEPALQEEVFQFAREMEYESAIKSSSNLHFLFKIYQAEKVKRRRSEKLLRKAEDLILRLATLHQGRVGREAKKKKEKKKLRIPAEVSITISEKMRTLFQSIGIDDEKVMVQTVEILGEEATLHRIDLIHLTGLGDELMKKLFGMFPHILLEPKEDDFLLELDTFENKKAIIDGWMESHGRLPSAADYRKRPDVLFEDYHKISKLLDIEEKPEEEEAPKKEVKYRPRAMRNRDMWRVLEELGYQLKRQKKEMTFEGPEGKTLTISNPHDGEYDPITIRRIIRDMGIKPAEFEKARRGAL
jgi:predicted RNA binding protein YcfA (HicA-like mRNA interferase family)